MNTMMDNMGIDKILIAIMDNDYNLPTYRTNIERCVTNVHAYNPGVEVVGVLLPDVQGTDRTAYRAALVEVCDSTIDATSFDLTGGNVGADGVHWTDTGNQVFAAIVGSQIAP